MQKDVNYQTRSMEELQEKHRDMSDSDTVNRIKQKLTDANHQNETFRMRIQNMDQKASAERKELLERNENLNSQ